MYMFEIYNMSLDDHVHYSGPYDSFETVMKEYPELEWSYSSGQHTMYAQTASHWYGISSPNIETIHEKVIIHD